MRWFNSCGREARPASAWWNVAKTLAQTTVFWATFLFLVPAGVYRVEAIAGLEGLRFAGRTGRTAGGVLFTAAGVLGLASGVVMAVRGRGTPLPADCPRALVIAGPYRYVRNPMAIAGLAQGAAVGLYVGSPLVLAYVLAGGVLWNVWVRRWEEADLARRFGEPFIAYRRGVRCWWPRRRPYAATCREPAGQAAEKATAAASVR